MDDEKVDKLPGSLAGGLAKLSENADTGEGLTFAPGDPNELADAHATIDWATHSLVTAGMTPKDLDPSFTDIVGAELRQNNVVASALSSHTLSEALTLQDDSKPLTHADVIQKVEANNLQPFFDYFKGARTENEFDAIKFDLERELEDKRIQEASGWTGTAVGLGAAIADVPSLLPGSIAVKGLAKAPGAMKAAIEFGLGGAAFAGAAEAGLQASQVTRTKEQTAWTIGSGTILGGVLGASVHALIGPAAADKAIGRLDEVRADAAKGYPQAQSVGAATASTYDQLAARGLDDDDRINSLGTFSLLEKLGDIPFIGQYLRNPAIDAMRSPSRAVRNVMETLANPGAITRRNAEGIASKENVEAAMTRWPGEAAQVEAEINDLWRQNKEAYGNDGADFKKRVAKAIVNGGHFDDPTITRAADTISNRIYGPIQKELVADGHFDLEPDIKNAERYAPIVYDADAIRAQKDDFIEHHVGEFSADLHSQAVDAVKAKEGLASDIEDAVIKNFGVDRKVPKVDENGQPVLNPKTGRQVQETKVVTPGTVREARKEIHAAADSDLAHKVNERDEALQAFDKGDPNPHVTTNETDALNPHFAERDKIKDERVNVTGERDDKLKDIASNLSEKEDEIKKAYEKERTEGQSAKPEVHEVDDEIARVKGDLHDRLGDLKGQRDDDIKTLEFNRDEAIADITEDWRKENIENELSKDQRRISELRRDKRIASTKSTAEKKIARAQKSYEKAVASEQKLRDKEISALEKKRSELAKGMTDAEKRELIKERDRQLDHERASADKEAKDVNSRAQKELDKLDARLKKAREEVANVYGKSADEIRTARDAKVAEAIENARNEIIGARGEGLEDGVEGTLKKYVRNGEVSPELIEVAARERAEHLYKQVTGQTRYVFGHDVHSVAGYRKARSNPAYHSNLIDKGWVETDPIKSLQAYTRVAGTDLALGKLFRKIEPKRDEFGKIIKDANGKPEMVEVADPNMSDALKKINDEYANLLSNVTLPKATADRLKKKFAKDPAQLDAELKKVRAKLEKKLLLQQDRDKKNVEILSNFLRGKTSGAQPGPASLHQAAEALGIWNFITKMGGVVVSSLGDPINIGLAQGFGNAAKYGIVPLIKDFREAYWSSSSELRKYARLALANTEMEHGSRLLGISDAGSLYHPQDFMEKGRRIAERFGKLSGITYWNDFVKQVSYNTIQARLLDMAGRGWEKLNAADQAALSNLGIDAATLGKIKTAYANQQEKFAANIPIARFDEWEDKVAAEKFRQAAYQESVSTVITPTASNRLALSSTPLGRIIFQFRNFMIANQMRLVGRNLQLANLDKEKAANVYTGLLGLVLMSTLIDGMKRAISNSDVEGSLADESQWSKWVDDWEKKPGQQLYNALDRSGHFGVLFEGSNIFDKLGLPSIQGGFRMATGENIDPEGHGTSRTRNLDPFGAVFGPTAGLISDVAKAGGVGTSFLAHEYRAFRGTDPEMDNWSFNRGDFKAVTRPIPGSNIFWLKPFINSGQRAVGNVFDWPDPN